MTAEEYAAKAETAMLPPASSADVARARVWATLALAAAIRESERRDLPGMFDQGGGS